MPRDFSRISRIGEVIQRELSITVQQEMRDPRLGMLTILDVEVTKDLKVAKVFFSVLDESKENVEMITKTLNDAAGFLRSQIAKKVQLRATPKLFFIYDDTLLKGNRIHKLIDDVVSNDNSSQDSNDSDRIS